jgi:hypothetical protein
MNWPLQLHFLLELLTHHKNHTPTLLPFSFEKYELCFFFVQIIALSAIVGFLFGVVPDILERERAVLNRNE